MCTYRFPDHEFELAFYREVFGLVDDEPDRNEITVGMGLQTVNRSDLKILEMPAERPRREAVTAR